MIYVLYHRRWDQGGGDEEVVPGAAIEGPPALDMQDIERFWIRRELKILDEKASDQLLAYRVNKRENKHVNLDNFIKYLERDYGMKRVAFADLVASKTLLE